MNAKWILAAVLFTSPARADELPVAPPPHEPAPPVSVAAIKGGYTVSLNRETAELLRDSLNGTDEKDVAATLRKFAKDKKEADPDDKTAATLELIAFVVANQLPGFKKNLNANIGPRGAVITLTGLQADKVKFPNRPKLEQALATARSVMPLLPEEARDVMEAFRAVGRTTPLFWKVEPRE
ncbi:MAG: hypothetical protein U0791_04610 [Gemmataceae bacterium]